MNNKNSNKPKSPAWDHFIDKVIVQKGVSKPMCECMYCHTVYSSHATRLAKHLLTQCKRITKNTKAAFQKAMGNSTPTKAICPIYSSDSSSHQPASSPIDNAESFQKTDNLESPFGPMSKFVDNMTAEENVPLLSHDFIL